MTLAIQPEEWHDDALCAQVGGDYWFPDKGGSTALPRSICRVCPVMDECRDYALRTNQRYGVWGGLSERQRRKVKHGRSAA